MHGTASLGVYGPFSFRQIARLVLLVWSELSVSSPSSSPCSNTSSLNCRSSVLSMYFTPRDASDQDYAGHLSRDLMYRGLGTDPSMLVNAAFALTTIGQFALVLLIATFLLSHTVYKRSPVLLNLLSICLLGTVPQFFL